MQAAGEYTGFVPDMQSLDLSKLESLSKKGRLVGFQGPSFRGRFGLNETKIVKLHLSFVVSRQHSLRGLSINYKV